MKLSRLRAAVIGLLHPECVHPGHDWSAWDDLDWSLIVPVDGRKPHAIYEVRICGRCSFEETRPKLDQFTPEAPSVPA